METELVEISTQLKEDMERAKDYHERIVNGASFDFKETILPFVNEVQARTERWRELASTFVSENEMRTLNLVQVEHTYENMYVIPTESFQAHVREQRYQERVQAIYYVLDLLFSEIKA